jgi:hypothetical protein
MCASARIPVAILALFFVLASPARSASPPDFLRWRRYEEPQFPPELQMTAVRDGFATVVFTFDDDGNLTDRLVITASHPAFTACVLRAAQHWQVDTEGLAPALRRENARFEFAPRRDHLHDAARSQQDLLLRLRR